MDNSGVNIGGEDTLTLTADERIREQQAPPLDHDMIPREAANGDDDDDDDDQLTSELPPPPPPPLMHVMKHGLPIMAGAATTIKYQNQKGSSSSAPAALWCLLLGTLAYWLIVGLMKQKPPDIYRKYSQTAVRSAALSAAVLSVASALALLLLPPYNPLSTLLPLIASMLLPLVLAWRNIYNLLYTKINAIVVWAKERLMINSSEEEEAASTV